MKKKDKVIRPIDIALKIDGDAYFKIADFARLTNRSIVNVRHLIFQGNRIRTLKCITFLGHPLIPYSELLEFPFTCAGRNNGDTYTYNENGEVVWKIAEPESAIEEV